MDPTGVFIFVCLDNNLSVQGHILQYWPMRGRLSNLFSKEPSKTNQDFLSDGSFNH